MSEDKKSSLKKNAPLWIFAGAALVVAILLAVFLSPFASSSPDGLEKVAEDKGFIRAAEETEPSWTHSPLPDYQVTAIRNERVSTGVSGLVGVLITVAVGVLVGLLALGLGRVWKKSEPGPGNPASET